MVVVVPAESTTVTGPLRDAPLLCLGVSMIPLVPEVPVEKDLYTSHCQIYVVDPDAAVRASHELGHRAREQRAGHRTRGAV